MRLAVAVALVANVATALLLAFGLLGSAPGCSAPRCTTATTLLAAGLVGLAVGAVAWSRGDPRVLLIVDLALMGLAWLLAATGVLVVPEFSWAVVPLAESVLLSCGIIALGRLWLERSAPGLAGALPSVDVRPAASAVARPSPRAPGTAPMARIGLLLHALDRLPPDRVRLLAVTPLDASAHDIARATALADVSAAGRSAEVNEARAAIQDWVRRWLSDNAYDPTFVAIAWRHEPLGPDDRLLLLETLDDAALGLISADLVDEATSDELIGPCAALLERDDRDG